MRSTRIGALALVTATTIAAVMAVSASAALPEFGRCVPAAGKTGQYAGANCVKPAGGKGSYNWMPGAGEKKKFVGTGEAIALETVGKRKISCVAASFEGEYSSPKTETVKVALIDCTDAQTGQLCSTNPLEEGNIEGRLEGELGYIVSGERPKVGLDLKPSAPSTPVFAFECGKAPEVPLLATVEGSVIASIVPIDKMAGEFKATYHATRGVQIPEHFEGGAKDTLTTQFVFGTQTSTEQTGFKARRADENEELIEIKAK